MKFKIMKQKCISRVELLKKITKAGGGIYYLKLNKNNWYIKNLSGPCYSLINYNKDMLIHLQKKDLLPVIEILKLKRYF